jgi:hypothetical protein
VCLLRGTSWVFALSLKGSVKQKLVGASYPYTVCLYLAEREMALGEEAHKNSHSERASSKLKATYRRYQYVNPLDPMPVPL